MRRFSILGTIFLVLTMINVLISTTSASSKISCESFLAKTDSILLMGFYHSDFILLTRDDQIFRSPGFIQSNSSGADLIWLPYESDTLAEVYPNLANSADYQRKKPDFSTGLILNDELVFLMKAPNQTGINYDLKRGSVKANGYKYLFGNNFRAVSTDIVDRLYRLETFAHHPAIFGYMELNETLIPRYDDIHFFCKKDNQATILRLCEVFHAKPMQNEFWIGFQHSYKRGGIYLTRMYMFDHQNVSVFTLETRMQDLPPYYSMAIADVFKCEKASGISAILIFLLILLILLILIGILYYCNCFASWGLARSRTKDRKSGIKSRKSQTRSDSKIGTKSSSKIGLKSASKVGLKSASKAGLTSASKAGLKSGPKAGLKSGPKAGLKSGGPKAGLKSGPKAGLKKSDPKAGLKSGQKPDSKKKSSNRPGSNRKSQTKASNVRNGLEHWPPTLPTSLMNVRSMKNREQNRK